MIAWICRSVTKQGEDSFQVGPGLDCELQSASVPNCSGGPGVVPRCRKLQRARGRGRGRWGGLSCSSRNSCSRHSSELQENCFASLCICAPFPISPSPSSDLCLQWPMGPCIVGPPPLAASLPTHPRLTTQASLFV